MRQRVTFFHHNDDAVDPESLRVSDDAISGPDIKAVREDRFTLGLEELPVELQEVLAATHELHLRWARPSPYTAIGPWSSRLSSGLHVFYTPRSENTSSVSGSQFCSLLQKLGVTECSSPNESFTQLPRDRFPHSTALEFYQPLDHLGTLVEYATQYACAPSKTECHSRMRSLEEAVLFDFSYDTVARVVKLTVMWDHKQFPISVSAQPGHRVEVGLLTTNGGPHIGEDEMGVAGLLTVLGEDKKPAPVMFVFPARHSQAGSSFSSSFHSPMGLHPTMQLRIGSSKPPKEETDCSLHAHLTLPRTIFADKYQLEDELFLASKNLTVLRYISESVDLEAPDYVMKAWGSSVLLELKPPAPDQGGAAFTAEIPLHLRYQAPEHGGQRPFEVPYPAVFWACPAEEETGFTSSPFDRVHLGYDELFDPQTLFWHLEPKPLPGGSRLMLGGQVPVLDLGISGSVATITAAVVIAGFAWVAWKLAVVYSKTGHGTPPPAVGGEKKQQ